MRALSKEQLLNKLQPKKHMVEVPDLGNIYIKELSARDALETQALAENMQDADIKVQLKSMLEFLASVIVDIDGKPLFASEAEKEILGNLSMSQLDAIFKAAVSINGLSEEQIEEAQNNLKNAQ